MASSATNFLPFIFLLILSATVHTRARESELFNKVPSATTTGGGGTTNVVKLTTKETPNNQPQEPTFLPENENVYGLYGHESSQLPPSTTGNGETETTTKYRPRNYNPVAYVTEPEDTNTFPGKSTTTNYGGGDLDETRFSIGETRYHRENNYRNGGGDYFNSPQENSMRGYRRNNNYYNNEETSSFNDINDNNRFSGGGATTNHREYFHRNGGDRDNFQREGMSDTRYLANGKYYYDINTEKYSSNHPYERLKETRARTDRYRTRNYYGDNENSYESNNSMEEFQNEDEFQENQEDGNMP